MLNTKEWTRSSIQGKPVYIVTVPINYTAIYIRYNLIVCIK